HWPIWSPDGKSIVFDSTRKKSHDLYMKPANDRAFTHGQLGVADDAIARGESERPTQPLDRAADIVVDQNRDDSPTRPALRPGTATVRNALLRSQAMPPTTAPTSRAALTVTNV